MIFATVGTQAPFDRMIRVVDAWAKDHPKERVIAQVGESDFVPQNCKSVGMLSPQACRDLMRQAHLVVSHAGMGTILTALELGKPVIIMPRRAALGEQRNDHQLATAEQLSNLQLVQVAADEESLKAMLTESHSIRAAARISSTASASLIHTLRRFLVDVSNGRDPSITNHRSKAAGFRAFGREADHG